MSKEIDIMVDIHCHSTLKPFGKSFLPGGAYPYQPSDILQQANVWHYNPPTFSAKILNKLATVVKFRQADFTSAIKGKMGVLFVSLYSPEKGFFNNELGTGIISDLPLEFVTGIGKNRINYIQTQSNYFNDLCNEYTFLKSFENRIATIGDDKALYKIISGFNELKLAPSDEVKTLNIVLTIEGAHCFNEGLDIITNPTEESQSKIIANIREVKLWPHRPLFVSMAHHFFNGMCGHAISLDGFISHLVDQKTGTDKGFTETGIKVLHKLLDNDENNRILIDIKHMNLKTRKEYYAILQSEYGEEKIPILVSHGAVTGYKNDSGEITIPGAPELFHNGDINFYDDEIVKIAQSGGIFGIQLDKRRIASKKMLKKAKGGICRKKVIRKWSKLVWNQIEHIAKVLDKNNLPAWDIVCLGSDYDGIVAPIPGFLTEEDLKDLDQCLLEHATLFLNNSGFDQKIPAEEIVEKFKSKNALEFLKRNYN